jgi:mono/diheme cytochrome c family protein
MRHASLNRTRPARVLRLLPLAALFAACGPSQEDGFAKVTHRGGPPTPPQATHPQPPAVAPGTQLSSAPQRVTMASMPAGMTQEMVDTGQDRFGTVCAACHGPGGTGTAAAPPLNDGEWLNMGGSFPEIEALINSGVPAPKKYGGAMPPRGGGQFTPEQVKEIAAYVYALSHQGGS